MMNDLEVELIVANETIREAEEVFKQLHNDYQALREHADQLEAILTEHNIPFLSFLDDKRYSFFVFNCPMYVSIICCY